MCLDTASTSIGNALACQQGPFLFICQQTLLCSVLWLSLCFLLLCLWQHEAMSRMTEGSQHGGQLRLQCGLLLQNILMIKCPSSQAAKVSVSLAQHSWHGDATAVSFLSQLQEWSHHDMLLVE